MKDIDTRWEKFVSTLDDTYESWREAINDFANREATSYDEYKRIFYYLASHYLKGDEI
jgi:hypothetical protein